MNKIIVYKSKYGSSRQYALWLAETLNCKAEFVNKVDLKKLQSYDVIIYAGGLYAGRVNGFKLIRKYLNILKDKKLILCMVGMTHPNQQEKYQEYFNMNVPELYQGNVQWFALRGDQLFSKMSAVHRIMMKMPKSMAEKIPVEKRSEEDQSFIDNFGKDVRFIQQESIRDIVRYVTELHN